MLFNFNDRLVVCRDMSSKSTRLVKNRSNEETRYWIVGRVEYRPLLVTYTAPRPPILASKLGQVDKTLILHSLLIKPVNGGKPLYVKSPFLITYPLYFFRFCKNEAATMIDNLFSI